MTAEAGRVGTPLVQVEQRGAVAVLTLNDPEVRNALSAEMREGLRLAIAGLQEELSCRAVVITGAGASFCAGGDVRVMGRGADPQGLRKRMEAAHDLVRRMVNGRLPIVAAIRGHAFGAGLSLAAACDYVLVASDARFGAAFGRIGLMPDMGLLWTLPRRVAPRHARQILLLSQVFDAPHALDIGLADEIVEADGLLDTALERAENLAQCAPLALGRTRNAIAVALDSSLDDLLETEIQGQTMLIATDDHAEGIAAFREKRPPVFKGA